MSFPCNSRQTHANRRGRAGTSLAAVHTGHTLSLAIQRLRPFPWYGRVRLPCPVSPPRVSSDAKTLGAQDRAARDPRRAGRWGTPCPGRLPSFSPLTKLCGSRASPKALAGAGAWPSPGPPYDATLGGERAPGQASSSPDAGTALPEPGTEAPFLRALAAMRDPLLPAPTRLSPAQGMALAHAATPCGTR